MQKVAKFLEEKVQRKIFTGAIAAIGNQRGIASWSSAGNLSETAQEPILLTTLFDLQSISKSVATVPVLLKLVEMNIVKLDAPASHWIHEWKNNPKNAITLRHLALHASGLSDDDTPNDFSSCDEAWKIMANQPLHFKPGESILYADAGYRFLGLALEKASGSTIDKLAKELIWDPLEMFDTCFKPNSIQNVAGPDRCRGRVDDHVDQQLGEILGCDGVFSSVKDLGNFCAMILRKGNGIKGKQILKPEHVELFFSGFKKYDSANISSHYEMLGIGEKTLGWEINDVACSYRGAKKDRQIEKAGGAGAFVWIDDLEGKFFIYLTNHGRPEPFTEEAWNKLVANLAPEKLSSIFEE